jgi:hypothetical protein
MRRHHVADGCRMTRAQDARRLEKRDLLGTLDENASLHVAKGRAHHHPRHALEHARVLEVPARHQRLVRVEKRCRGRRSGERRSRER